CSDGALGGPRLAHPTATNPPAINPAAQRLTPLSLASLSLASLSLASCLFPDRPDPARTLVATLAATLAAPGSPGRAGLPQLRLRPSHRLHQQLRSTLHNPPMPRRVPPDRQLRQPPRARHRRRPVPRRHRCKRKI